MSEPLILYGSPASPYSMKVLAALRYRRIPHRFVTRYGREIFEQVRAPVIPVAHFPSGEWMNDSTPLLLRLEAEHTGRSLRPPTPVEAFLCDLIEDFADEWGTKLMFYYRWAPEADRMFNALSIVSDSAPSIGRQALIAQAEMFAARQTGRLPMVAGAGNVAAIEASAHAIFGILDALAPGFLFGGRPSAADFGWFGQMSQLVRDPTPRALVEQTYPFAAHWTRSLLDLSGLEGEWGGEAYAPMAKLAARLYLPFLAANAEAAAGESEVRMTVEGHPYAQAPFKYQVRCLETLRAGFAGLTAADQTRVGAILDHPSAVAILKSTR
jgi:glutathione S-transferase